MVKTSKRSRKFQAKGGIKGMIDKGQKFAKKGKVGINRNSKKAGGADAEKEAAAKLEAQAIAAEEQRAHAEDDFISGRKNQLANMGMDDFFNDAVLDVDSEDGEESDDVVEENEEESSDSDEDDEDDDSKAEQRHAEEMKKLQEKDPAFFQYLQENEASLLEFGDDNESGDESSDDEMEEDLLKEKKNSSKDSKVESPGVILTKELLDKLEHSTFVSHGFRGFRQLISAYRTACHLSNPNDEQNFQSGGFIIEDSNVYDKLMVLVLGRCHDAFHRHLLHPDSNPSSKGEEEKIDINKPLNPNILIKAKKWSELQKLLEIFFRSTLHLLREAKEPELLEFIVKSCSNFLPFLTPFPKLAKGLLKQFVSLWCAPFDSQNDHVVRLQAFIRIRQLALTQPYPFIEDSLKTVYLAYAKSAKFSTETALATLTFMGNCVVELYSLDTDSSYQHAFIYIRQLALHLRTAIQKKTKEAFQVVYSWQYLNCLKVWTAVLSANPNESELRSLIYPLTEIIIGVIRLLPTTRHLPIRLHCVRLLQQLAACSETFIPVTSILLDVIDLKEISLKPKKATTNVQGVRLPLIIKLPKSDPLRTMDQLEACIGETFVLLNREIDLYRYSAGFPEFTFRICQRLRKFSKETRVGRWKAYAKGCIDLCERHANKAIQDRSKLEEAPKDIKKLEILKPANAPNMKDRYDAAISKEKRLESATKPEVQKEVERQATETKKRTQKDSGNNKKSKKSKLKVESEVDDVGEEEALERADEVAQGIDWSDDESE